jgi:hypothetical protein
VFGLFAPAVEGQGALSFQQYVSFPVFGVGGML